MKIARRMKQNRIRNYLATLRQLEGHWHFEGILFLFDDLTEVVGMDVQPDTGEIGNILDCN